MAIEFFIPKLGQTVEEVIIASWLVADGARVEKGQPIIEVETDKAVFPVEANADGILHRGPFMDGDVVPVVTTVAIIGTADDHFEVKVSAKSATLISPAAEGTPAVGSQTMDSNARANSEPEPVSKFFTSPRARRLATEKNVDLRKVTPSGGQGIRVVEQDVLNYLSQLPRASPLAQKMAAETGLVLDGLRGSGPGGRIMKDDIERTLQIESPSRKPEAAQPAPEGDVLERVPLSGVRGIIAERMAVSVHSTARVTLVMEVDATEFVILRDRLKARFAEEWGFAPGYNDLLAKITAVALRNFPYMNARLTTDAIEYLKPIHIGIAVDTQRGLLVPVIRNADQKNLRHFAQEFRDLVDRARNRKSLPDDLSGGTFTITSLGSFGVDAFTPIINLPEAAILGVGRIAEKVVPRDGQMVIRSMLTLSLVFDHRLVDGAPAARFLSYIRELIEEPHLLVSVL